ncbi:Gfo/Idh/MocA family protein [Dongia sedimenti]|uniref:Gfo/Idh/MocA family oxidoreductase n=1 Tax=Dongia sedimenti TaxID=3064282 RepID=A0ABU0YF65_9PROT|nr:Gfo/Idh/MocA family oxidoreductase [Rhodospirillaceae bacterium R-7]
MERGASVMTGKHRTFGWSIIGASQIARSWVGAAIRANPQARLVSVMSRDRSRGEAFARALGIAKVETALEAVLNDPTVDALYVSTGNDRHAEVTLAAAAAGKHVLCEKPLGLTLEEAVGMAQACDRAGIVLATNHHMRAAATHREIRRLVQSGAVGRPLAARALYCEYLPPELQTWRTRDPRQGGVLYDLTVHNVDALRFALGADPVEAMGMKASSLIGAGGVEDQAQSVLRFDSGLIAYLHEGYAFAHHETALEVHGETGSIYGRGIMDEAPNGTVFLRRNKEMTEIPTEPVNLYEGTVAAFQAAIREGSRPAATGWDGVWSLAAALAIRESAETGRMVAVPDVSRIAAQAA